MSTQLIAWFLNLFRYSRLKLAFSSSLIITLSWLFIAFTVPEASSHELNMIKANKLIELTNEQRIIYDLPELHINPELTRAAFNKAQDLLNNEYFSHNSPQGKKFSQWVKDVEYNYNIVGENLAMGFVSEEAIVKAWMTSQDHRDNILKNKYREIGIAVLEGEFEGKQTKMVVQIFGASDNLRISELYLPYNLLKDIDKVQSYG
ncbi:hypothetical protein HOE31_03710 [bacterium]|jgi:uncharacterized protein YkwD|nr:hypothetical protein [bacterium]MBT4335503.1 hypothetical protein [bacterium]MBT4495940.1 hypothetical protein [bacterium]MBT4764274.1 hypothetical protein [bacterium]MBT5401644.1 hypothetical protein [bacterium]